MHDPLFWYLAGIGTMALVLATANLLDRSL